jgi:hypothetical protein
VIPTLLRLREGGNSDCLVSEEMFVLQLEEKPCIDSTQTQMTRI